MDIKDLLNKVGKMDTKHFSLLIECGIILSKLTEEEQDKLLEMIDLIIDKAKQTETKEVELK